MLKGGSARFGLDSIAVVLWIDGCEIFTQSIPYSYGSDFIQLTLQSEISVVPLPRWTFSLDDIAIGPTRAFRIPAQPGIQAHNDNGTITLDMIRQPVMYQGEAVAAVRRTIYKAGDTIFPVFENLVKDPAYLFSYTVPFQLDSRLIFRYCCGAESFR